MDVEMDKYFKTQSQELGVRINCVVDKIIMS